mmetsp:Transcript_17556/g.54865  ORF Transcript_17556/g.54865 Transcript_17556/m.54865 type:complete len:130 (+) Transcript_17556:2199-2588(+)
MAVTVAPQDVQLGFKLISYALYGESGGPSQLSKANHASTTPSYKCVALCESFEPAVRDLSPTKLVLEVLKSAIEKEDQTLLRFDTLVHQVTSTPGIDDIAASDVESVLLTLQNQNRLVYVKSSGEIHLL